MVKLTKPRHKEKKERKKKEKKKDGEPKKSIGRDGGQSTVKKTNKHLKKRKKNPVSGTVEFQS
jgi:hypothetical protein